MSILQRVVLVWAAFGKSDEGKDVGKTSTGYLIGTEWVLTAGHGVHEAKTIKVLLILPGEESRNTKSHKLWVPVTNDSPYSPYNKNDITSDGALLRLDLTNSSRENMEKIKRLTRTPRRWSVGLPWGRSFFSCGYPVGAKYAAPNNVIGIDTLGFNGTIVDGGNQLQGLLQLSVRSGGPLQSEDWAGVSGAPIFVAEQLVAVVSRHGRAFTEGLDAVPLALLERNSSFKSKLDEAWASATSPQDALDARSHDLKLWLGEPSYQRAVWAWLFCLDEDEPRIYTRKEVEERFCASPLTTILNTISHLVDELKPPYGESEARNRARNLLFNLLPLHSSLLLESDDIGADVRDALRIRGQLDLCRTEKKILARRELYLPKGIGSATVAAVEQGPGLVKAFVGVVQEQMKWDEQTAREAIEGDTLRYFDEVRVQIARKKNTDEIERPFFITLSQSENPSDVILETLRTELNIGVYVKDDHSTLGIRAALGRALVTLGATQSDLQLSPREDKDLPS